MLSVLQVGPSERTAGCGLMATLYDVLGIGRGASAADIRSAYLRAALATHPDKRVCATEEDKQRANEAFNAVVTAGRTLSDPSARARYDAAMFGTLVDAVGRVSDRFGFDEFAAADADRPQVWACECRCGGVYEVVGAVAPGETRHAECDTCSLLVEVVG